MLEGGLIASEAYTALCPSRRQLETLEEQLRKKALPLKHMKLEIESNKSKSIINYHEIFSVCVFFPLHQGLKGMLNRYGAYFQFLLEKGSLLKRGL